MKKTGLFIFVFLASLFLFATPVFAFTARGGEDLSIAESIDDDVYAFSNNITFSGNINGDMITAGSQINILGPIKGDLLAAGGTININSEIGDTVRAIGGMITVNSQLKKDLVAAGGQVEISSNALVDGDVVINAARVVINGNVNGNLKLSASDVILNGQTTGSVTVNAANIKIGDTAKILGDFSYTSEKEAQISANAEIVGKTKWIKSELQAKAKPEFSPDIKKGALAIFTATWFGGKVVRFFSSFALGLILLLLIPKVFNKFNARIKNTPGLCVAGGAIVLFGSPVAMLIILVIGLVLLITLIGSALGGLMVFANFYLILSYALLLFTNNIFLSFFIGSLILKKKTAALDKYGWKLLAFLIGLLITSILFAIPFMGWLTQFAAILFGLGGLAMIIKDWLISFKKNR